MSLSLEPVLAHLESNLDASIERWKELLRIPSVGTDPARRADTRRAAEWLVEQLRALGFEAAARDTPGQPIVVGHHPGPGAAAGPRVLYYGHYDVQPADPLELWDSPPFEPTLVEAAHGPRMIARGAVDDKGQLMTWLEALRAWHEVHGTPPVPTGVFVEGEEESGSPSLERFLESRRDELRADICVVSDTNMWNIETPALATLLRGLLYTEITLSGPAHDLHSGLYGGAAPNPLNVLSRILGQLHDADGRVQIPGFYDDVEELDERERRRIAVLPFDEAAFLGNAGLTASTGEAGRSTLERNRAPCASVPCRRSWLTYTKWLCGICPMLGSAADSSRNTSTTVATGSSGPPYRRGTVIASSMVGSEELVLVRFDSRPDKPKNLSLSIHRLEPA